MVTKEVERDLLPLVAKMLRQAGVRPSRRLSQSFLASSKGIKVFLRGLSPEGWEAIIEPGAGLGFLTASLARQVSDLVAVEIDCRLARVLSSYLRSMRISNTAVVCTDALEYDFSRFDRVVSNTPYHISSPLLFKVIREMRSGFAIMAFQKEFARRLLARPGTPDYGRLSVSVALSARVDIVGFLPKTWFFPMPKVDSLVVKISPRSRKYGPMVDDLLRYAFSRRRKLARKVLGKWLRERGVDARLDWVGEKRVYELRPEDFLRIAEAAGL